MEYLSVAQIRADGGTQMRAGLNQETVAEYAEWLAGLARQQNGLLKMPAIIVYHDGSEYWLADGFHRLEAWKRCDGLPTAIQAIVHAGDRRKAILHAAGANAEHGLRRSNADKRRAVETLLRDDEWRLWSDAEIGRTCAVDSKTVGAVRRELQSNQEIPDSPIRKTADGHTFNTANVGRKAEPPDMTLDQAIAFVWQQIKQNISSSEDGPRLAWLRMQNRQFWRKETSASWGVLEAAIARVEANLEGSIDHAKRTEQKQQAMQPPPPTPLEQAIEEATVPAPEPRTLSAAKPNDPALQKASFVMHRTDQGYRYFWPTRGERKQSYGPIRSTQGYAEEDALAALNALVLSVIPVAPTVLMAPEPTAQPQPATDSDLYETGFDGPYGMFDRQWVMHNLTTGKADNADFLTALNDLATEADLREALITQHADKFVQARAATIGKRIMAMTVAPEPMPTMPADLAAAESTAPSTAPAQDEFAAWITARPEITDLRHCLALFEMAQDAHWPMLDLEPKMSHRWENLRTPLMNIIESLKAKV